MPEPRPAESALERIRLQIEAIDVAMSAIASLRDAGEITIDYAEARLLVLENRESDLLSERRTIVLTGVVSNPPTGPQLEELRRRTTELRNQNVSAAAIQGIVAEAFAIAGAVGATRSVSAAARMNSGLAGKSEACPVTPPALLAAAFAGGIALGMALFAATTLLPRDKR